MCHLPSSYILLEDTDKIPGFVIVGGGEEDEVPTRPSGPFPSRCFAFGRCTASEVRFEFAKDIEAVAVELKM